MPLNRSNGNNFYNLLYPVRLEIGARDSRIVNFGVNLLGERGEEGGERSAVSRGERRKGDPKQYFTLL